MTLTQKRRIEKIERTLKTSKCTYRPFTDGQGGFVEIPSHLTLIDIIVMCMAMEADGELDETELK